MNKPSFRQLLPSIRKKSGSSASRQDNHLHGQRRPFLPEIRLFLCAFASLVALLLFQVRSFPRSNGIVQQNNWVRVLKVNVKIGTSPSAASQTITLPETIKALPHQTTVTVEFETRSDGSNMLFLNPVYSPVKIYADDVLIYSYGTPGTWPSFMIDPPTAAFSVKLPAQSSVRPLRIRLVYTSPKSRSSLILHPMVIGSGDAVLRYLFRRYGFSELSSLLFIIAGIILCMMSLFFLSFERHGMILTLPGLLVLSAGIWEFSENALSVYLTHRPSLLYILSFVGMYTMLLPLIFFTQKFTQTENSLPLRLLRYFLEAAVILSLFLQLSGLVPFTRSVYLSHVLLPSVLVFMAFCMLYLAIFRQNKPARAMFLAILALAVAALLELVNYYVVFTDQVSVFFQVGLQLFALLIIAFGCVAMRRTMRLSYQNLVLAHDMELLEHSIEVQKERGHVLTVYESEVRRQSHDLRHHLRFLRQLLESGQTQEAASYIDSLEDSIPVNRSSRYCENSTVNAVISYYAAIAQGDHIRMKIDVQIPAVNPHISDSHLCVILGNLLENAEEACRRMKDGDKYILLKARIHGGLLFISMDNSYDGIFQVKNGHFISRKRNEEGIGLKSVRSLAQSHAGSAEFIPGEKMFRSEICIML